MQSLIICNSTYQLLVALKIKMELCQKESVDIVLSDWVDFTVVAENLKRNDLFANVYLVKSKENYVKMTPFQRKIYRYILPFLGSNEFIKKTFHLNLLTLYDQLFVCNMMDPLAEYIYATLAKANKNLKLIEYEDGYGTYVRPLRFNRHNSSKVYRWYSIWNKKGLFEENISSTLLFHPELYVYHDDVPKQCLSSICEDMEFRKQLAKAFGLGKSKYLTTKFILLEESFAEDGVANNYFELFEEVIKIVGVENVMLKRHPRNHENVFHYPGLKILDAPISWEALISNEDISSKILVTVSSSTGLNPKLLYKNNECKVIYLYKMLTGEQNSAFKEVYAQEYFERVHKMFPDSIFFPEDNATFIELLREWS